MPADAPCAARGIRAGKKVNSRADRHRDDEEFEAGRYAVCSIPSPLLSLLVIGIFLLPFFLSFSSRWLLFRINRIEEIDG